VNGNSHEAVPGGVETRPHAARRHHAQTDVHLAGKGLAVRPLLRSVGGKLLTPFVLLLLISLFVFIAFSLVPGDPAQQLLGQSWTPEAGKRLREQLGLNDPVLVQYVRFLWRAAHGDLGRSYMTRLPVLQSVSAAFLNSLQLAGTALVIAVVAGVSFGTAAALRRNSWLDVVSRVITVSLSSVPAFVVGIVLIYVFAAQLHLLPSGGRGEFRHLVLPAVALSFFAMAGFIRMVRATVLEVLRQDYIKAARSRGISWRKIIVRYVLRNAAIPLVTLGGLYAGTMIGTAVVTEYVFAWPGLGTLTITAIQSRDIPTIQGGILTTAATYIVLNSLLDILYGVIDPRARVS
jgi:peptide/nickel transport system permease protein